MQLKSFISFILFYFLFINNSFSESISLICKFEDLEDKQEIIINKSEKKVYIRKLGSKTWQQQQDYIEDNNYYVWGSPLENFGEDSEDYLVLVGLEKKTLILHNRYYKYDFSKSKEVFFKWMSLNNYYKDYVRDNPHLLVEFLVYQVKDLQADVYTKYICE